MQFTVHPDILSLEPTLTFGILIGRNLTNSLSTLEDETRLRQAEAHLRNQYLPEQVRQIPSVAFYRTLLSRGNINPNKFPPSVEAMYKRVLKGGHLPLINALVDLCNAVSLEQTISLGAHDLADIHHDLEVRHSQEGDKFLPFGTTEWENVAPGEIIFTSGHEVQTRNWLWRQSELGKTTLNSQTLIFQLVGSSNSSLQTALQSIATLIETRFQGTCQSYIVNHQQPSISF